MPPSRRGIRRAYVLQNVGTGSFVTHTESSFGVEPVCLIWDDYQKAKAHAKDLGIEYQITRPSLPRIQRTWRVRAATRDQLMKALAVGAYGPEYTARIRDTTEQVGGGATTDEQAEAFRQELDNSGRNN
jgi:hypothetical protein